MVHYELTRFIILRSLAFIYVIGFINSVNQFKALLGSEGLLPAKNTLLYRKAKECPSLFWINSSDRFFIGMGYLGLFVSLIALFGISDQFGLVFHIFTWFVMWGLYLSFVNVGRTWYQFGWESLLLECGFLAIFLGSIDLKASPIVIFIMRWMLFRILFGAGLIKLRGDKCWRDLTCLYTHYFTQPMPNPLSWFFHHLPKWVHKLGVLFNHFVELIVPFFIFFPAPICYIAGLLSITFQLALIFSGNLSWLNYITIVVSFSCFDDRFFSHFISWQEISLPSPIHYQLLIYAYTLLVIFLSYKPTINLISKRQLMNYSFEPFHLVNTYGAFGAMSKYRPEIIIEGCLDENPNQNSIWKEYEFKGKPGDLYQRPPFIAPYHLRLDWLMWFAAMSSHLYHPWFQRLLYKLLKNDRVTLKLLRSNPFKEKAPKLIRAKLYSYTFTEKGDKTGRVWNRVYLKEYFPAVSLDSGRFEGWG